MTLTNWGGGVNYTKDAEVEVMYTLREVLELRLENYNISKEERVRYQLHKQKITLSQLLEKRDENGKDRTEEELALYHKGLKGLYGEAEKDKYTRYMTKMPHKGYLEICKRLRIEPVMDLQEMEEIRIWKERIDANNISFKKRKEGLKTVEGKKCNGGKPKENTKPTKSGVQKRRELTEGLEDIARHNVGLQDEWLEEEEKQFDEYLKNEFVQYAKSVPANVLYVWHQYPQFFHIDYALEVFFLELYTQLNAAGKELYQEMITMYMTEQDFQYMDERTKLYTDMVHLSAKNEYMSEKDIEVTAGEIFELWGNRYLIEEFPRLVNVVDTILNCVEEDWEVLKNYHRVQVLGKELDIRGHPFVEYMDVALYMIADAPSMK